MAKSSLHVGEARVRGLVWTVAVALSLTVATAQVPRHVVAAIDARSAAVQKALDQRRMAKIEDSRIRARAHARLRGETAIPASKLLCPVYQSVARGPQLEARGKPVDPRFRPRYFASPRKWPGVAAQSEPVASLFGEFISGPIVQSRCINCHVQGGISGHTRIVFSPSSESDHVSRNLAVFENFVASVEGGADKILAKIQGVGHGGGIQVPAGSADFANIERFLRLLDGSSSGSGISPATLFDGVSLASPAKTLRRAALIFAGRIPTEAEMAAVSNGSVPALRRAIRGLMIGPGFHEFLLRAANDRLLTDRHLEHSVLGAFNDNFPSLVNTIWDKAHAALERGYERPYQDSSYEKWHRQLDWGVARAPLELIAHVVENDRPYTEILTADYIMANFAAAEAYGASTMFVDPGDIGEFRPSSIEAYFRDDDSKITEGGASKCDCMRVINTGNLSTEYPHAGVLNTTVFLRRYPSTATNRNRARSRWTYYHFLGVDIEKSASRTTDPVALADTDNPTMKNPACTVCHAVMDPVAGTFQNYGDEGIYRDQWGGLDSLPSLYKRPEDGSISEYQEGDTWYRDMREPGFSGKSAPDPDNSVQWLARQIVADDRFAEATVRFWWSPIMGAAMAEPPEDQRDANYQAGLLASAAQAAEIKRLASGFREGFDQGMPYNLKDLLVEIAVSDWFRANSIGASDPVRLAALRDAGVERLLTPEELVRKTEAITGYSWGRRYDNHLVVNRLSDSWDSYRLLYGGIDSDGITVRAREVTPLMAAVAQSHGVESSCPIVLREFYMTPDRERLLFKGLDPGITPDSESRASFEITATSRESVQTVSTSVEFEPGPKTVRLAFANARSHPVHDRNLVLDRIVLRDAEGRVVHSVELESLRRQPCGGPDGEEFRLWSNCELKVPVTLQREGTYRVTVLARQEAAGDEPARLTIQDQSFDVVAEEWVDRGEFSIEQAFSKGRNEVVLGFENDYFRSVSIFVGGVVVLDAGGEVVQSLGKGSFERGCGDVNGRGEADLNQWEDCSLQLNIATRGTYAIEVTAVKRFADTPLSVLEIATRSVGGGGAGEAAIRNKISELHWKLFGRVAAPDSPDVEAAFQLFRTVWERKQASGERLRFMDGANCRLSGDHLFFGDLVKMDERGDSVFNWDRANRLFWDELDTSDPFHVARTWVVVLAYLLADYEYLYL